MGLDIGTTSISAVVFAEEHGGLETKSVQNGPFLLEQSWERLQDPQVICAKAFKLVEELRRNYALAPETACGAAFYAVRQENTRGF